MDSFTFNKIAGAVLGTCLIGMGIGIVAQGIYSPEPPKKQAYVLPGDVGKAEGGGTSQPKVIPISVLLAKADPKKGEQDAKVCGACHNFAEGAGAKVGPDLYGVVGRPKGSAPGFDYSAGMKKKGGNWTFADINTFITKPSAYVEGTKMSYPGEENAAKRADIIAYLRTLSKKPEPLPQVSEADKKAAEGGEQQAAAGGEAKGGGGDDIVKLIAAADPKTGESDAQVCGACHNFKEGAGTKVGPDLYGVVDRPKASVSGFDYSAALKAKGGKWTYQDLNEWLTSPAKYAQGTKMGYAGEPSEKKRAAIIAYLRSLAKTPAPLPKVEGAKQASADAGAAKPTEAPTAGAGAAGGGDFVKLVAAASPEKGKSAAQICGACHNFKEGGGTIVGPDLYGVVDRPKASVAGFDYSSALKAKGGKWTYDDLNQWLTNPQAYVHGTKMGFAGEPDEKKRAEIVAYLHSLAKTPAPLPGAGGSPAAKSDDQKPNQKKTEAAPTSAKPEAKKTEAAPPPAKPEEKKTEATPTSAPAKPDEKAEAPAAPPSVKPEAKKAEAAPPPAKPEAKKTEAAPAPAKPGENKTGAAPTPAPAKSDDKKAEVPAAPAPAKTGEKKAETLPSANPSTAAAVPGPEPYDSADPQYPSDKAEAALPQAETVAPALSQDSDKAAAASGAPEPYSAPNPDASGESK